MVQNFLKAEGCAPPDFRPDCDGRFGDGENLPADENGPPIVVIGVDTKSGLGVMTANILLSSLVHEMIHVVDRCRNKNRKGKKVDPCVFSACTEIRGASGSPQCDSPGASRASFEQCVKNSAVTSTANFFKKNPECWKGKDPDQSELDFVRGIIDNYYDRCALDPCTVSNEMLPEFPIP